MSRALCGPTVYDRVRALTTFGTKTVLLIAVLGFLAGRPEFLDLALVYALINFIGTIAVLKLVEIGDLGRGRRRVPGSLRVVRRSDPGIRTPAGLAARRSGQRAERHGVR